MGGAGSGRRSTGTARALVSDALELDVGELVRRGVIGCGIRTSTIFRWPGESGDGAAVRIESRCRERKGSAVLSYSLDGEAVRLGVRLQTTRPNFGGRRWWLTCPQCRRRVAKLYFNSGDHFTCRGCQDLAYASSRRSRPRARS